MLYLGILVGLVAAGQAFDWMGTYYCEEGRDVSVHLFEWRWADIAAECDWLASYGFCAVQVSPPNEHRIVTEPSYPWYQRYQPVSYYMDSRSGTEADFVSMVETCNDRGVFIYVDGVINHMTGGGEGIGSAGNWWSGDLEQFPAVPYMQVDGHFHGRDVCTTLSQEILDYGDIDQVRYCRLLGLRDLRGGYEPVRAKVIDFMNNLINIGVAGFRIDAAKHMWPKDMENMFARLNNLNTLWFPVNTKAYIYQEVIELSSEGHGVLPEYWDIGRVTEFRYGKYLGECFRKQWGQQISFLQNFGLGWGMVAPMSALVFTDNHDNQRGHGGGGESVLTFRDPMLYKMANAFQLAFKYGHVRLMSSYYWETDLYNGKDQNDWVGPPSDPGGVTKNVECFNGDWMCEHKWRQIANMVKFHNAVLFEPIDHWWDNGGHFICFSRGTKGFIAINNEDFSFGEGRQFQTGMPEGEYCNVIHCDQNRPPCSGNQYCHSVHVGPFGWADIVIQPGNPADSESDPVCAIYV